MSDDGVLRVAAVGDALITRRLEGYSEPGYLAMLDLLRGADAAFVNFEMLIPQGQGYPGAESGGTWLRAEPMVAEQLRWAGFHLASLANNHGGDYAAEGLLATRDALRSAGLAVAGAGRHLAEARAPAYHDAARGRVGLLACTSTFTAHSRAGAQRPDCPGRPGVSTLRFDTRHLVDEAALRELQRIHERLGLEGAKRERERLGFDLPRDEEEEGDYVFIGSRFDAADHFAVETSPHKGDLAGILQQVAEARRSCDVALVSIHCHEADNTRELPPRFLTAFAHACIDAGADAVLGHGPHLLRAIEVYKGKPILYSLGNFCFQSETTTPLPADAYERWKLDPLGGTPGDFYDKRYDHDRRGFPADPIYWESVVAELRFQVGTRRFKGARLHPIVMGHGEPRGRRGRPMLAPPAAAPFGLPMSAHSRP